MDEGGTEMEVAQMDSLVSVTHVLCYMPLNLHFRYSD